MTWARHVTHMGIKWDIYRVLKDDSESMNHQEVLDAGGRIILK
jgi:hypothetical protein